VIQLRGLRTGVEISGAEGISLVEIPGDRIRDREVREGLSDLGFTLPDPDPRAARVIVGNPDVWVHELLADGQVVGQFVMGTPAPDRLQAYLSLNFTEEQVRDELCGGIAFGKEYWIGFDDVDDVPTTFEMRGAGYPVPLLRPTGAFELPQGVFGAERSPPAVIEGHLRWAIRTDAADEPIGYLSMGREDGRVVQHWWALEDALDGGLIPAGGDGRWRFGPVNELPTSEYLTLTLVLD